MSGQQTLRIFRSLVPAFLLGLGLLLLLSSPANAKPPASVNELYSLAEKEIESSEVGQCSAQIVAVAVRFEGGARLWATDERWVLLEQGTIYAGIVKQDEMIVQVIEVLEVFKQRYPVPCAWLAPLGG
jgi:hypothetical protein